MKSESINITLGVITREEKPNFEVRICYKAHFSKNLIKNNSYMSAT